MTKTFAAFVLVSVFASSAFASGACDSAARKAAAEKIRGTQEIRQYPHPYVYGITVTNSGNTYKAEVSFGDASGSDTSETSNCTVYTTSSCRVTDVACDVQ